MEKGQNIGKVQPETNPLTPQQESWVGFWDKWYSAALRVGDMGGARLFLANSIKVLEGVDVPEMMAPEKPSVAMSFQSENDYKTHFYSW